MSVSNCPSCNTPVPPGSIFCVNCCYDLRTVAPGGTPAVAPTYHVSEPGGGEMVCPSCGHPNVGGSAFCENCGSQIVQAQPAPAAPPPVAPAPVPSYQPPAAPAPAPAPVYQPPVYQPPVAPPPPAMAPAGSITGRLVIQASNASLPIPMGKQTVVIGREDPVSGIFPDIDLDPYGAQEEGVGRKHAQLVWANGQVCVEDLESVNGTVLNRQKVLPRQPQPLKEGDELRFGKMVVIYHTS
jgi:hypothetical protein